MPSAITTCRTFRGSSKGENSPQVFMYVWVINDDTWIFHEFLCSMLNRNSNSQCRLLQSFIVSTQLEVCSKHKVFNYLNTLIKFNLEHRFTFLKLVNPLHFSIFLCKCDLKQILITVLKDKDKKRNNNIQLHLIFIYLFIWGNDPIT